MNNKKIISIIIIIIIISSYFLLLLLLILLLTCKLLMCIFMPADDERLASYWDNKAKEALNAALQRQPNLHQAKNVILFLGDGEFRTELCFLSYISIHN